MPADELHQLAVDLGRVPSAMIRETQKSVEVTARYIKDSWNSNLGADAGRRMRPIDNSVDYDMKTGVGAFAALGVVSGVRIEAEIGPNLATRQRLQAAMAGWFESGSVDGIPATKPGDRAMKEWSPDFFKGLEIAAANALRDTL